MTHVFLDAAYAIALSSPRDQHHLRARQLAEKLAADAVRMVTTRAVVLEIGNALAKQRYRRAATALLQALERDPNVEIVPLTEALYHRAMEWYLSRPDKEWGLTDCVSFVVMRERELADALTADAHFEQAGFRALLRET